MDPNLSQAIASIQAGDTAYQTQIAELNVQIEGDRNSISALQFQLQQAQDQIAALQAVTVFDGLELKPATVAGGSVANSAGNTGVAADAQSVPTDKNAFRQIFPSGSYQNKYWYWQLGADSSKSKYTYEIRFMLPTASDCSASQALELDIEHRISQQVFNTGLQFDFQANQVRIWNRSQVPVHGWIATALSCPRWNPGEWHTIKLETHRDGSNVVYDGITIDGVRTALTASFPTITLAESDCLNCAVQLDANKAGTAYLTYIDAVRFTAS